MKTPDVLRIVFAYLYLIVSANALLAGAHAAIAKRDTRHGAQLIVLSILTGLIGWWLV